MAVSKLVCPECETVLRPAKPLAEGKKVKCPKCGTTFPAKEANGSAPKSPPSTPSKKKKAEPAEKKAGPEYESASYGVVWEKGDHDEQSQEQKEERGNELVEEYLKVKKTKDPRGIAQTLMKKPTDFLYITGAVGALGCIIVLLAITIIKFMPTTEQEERADDNSSQSDGSPRKKLKGLAFGRAIGLVTDTPDLTDKESDAAKKQDADTVHSQALSYIKSVRWYGLILLMSVFVVGIVYGAVIIHGAVLAQSMESRGWGIASSILVMVPIISVGFSAVTVVLMSWVGSAIYEESMLQYVLIGLLVLEGAWGVSIGIWNIKTLKDETVIAAFEYDEDVDSEGVG